MYLQALSQLSRINSLDQVCKLFLKGPDRKHLDFTGYVVSTTAIQLCFEVCTEAAIDNVQINGCTCVQIECYLKFWAGLTCVPDLIPRHLYASDALSISSS